MSSHKEVSIEETNLGPEDGEATTICLFVIPCSPQERNLVPDMEFSQSDLSKDDEVEAEDNSESDTEFSLNVLESGVVVFQGHGEQAVSSGSDKGDVMDSVPLNSKDVEMVQQPTDQMGPCAGRHSSPQSCTTQQHSSPKSCTTQLCTASADAEAGGNKNGKLAKRMMDVKQVPAAPLHRRGPKRGIIGKKKKKKKKRGTKSKKMVNQDIQHPTSNPDSSSEEYNKMQVISVSICFKNGNQIVSGSAMEPRETVKKRNAQPRGNFHHMTGSPHTCAPRGHISSMGNLRGSHSNKKTTAFRGKEWRRLSYPGAASDGLPKANSKTKAAQETKHLQDASSVTIHKLIPLWRQRPKAAPLESATFPPITCAPTLNGSKRYSMTSLVPIQHTHVTSRKMSVARSIRESQPVVRGDKDTMKNSTMIMPTSESSKLEEIPQVHEWTSKEPHVGANEHQKEPQRAEQLCTCMHRGEMSSGDPNTRAMQVAGHSQLMALSQRGTRPRAPAPSSDHEPSVCPPIPAGERLSVAAPGCQQCPVLEKEVQQLRKQLAALLAINQRFQAF